MDFTDAGFWSLIVFYSLRVIGVFVVLFAGWVIAKWAHRAIITGLDRAHFDVTLTRFTANMARWAILIFAILACLSLFGIQTASFAAVLAAAGFAIGLAFQGSLSNFASGVLLLTFRPFKVGDVVEVSGHLGKVMEIDLVMTLIDSFDNRRIIIPNSSVLSSTIVNLNFHGFRRVDVQVGTDYPEDVDRVRRVLEAAAEECAGRMPDRETQVVLNALGDSAIEWEVRVWAVATEFLTVKQELTRQVKKSLDEAGIGIPFPQMDVHFDEQLEKALTNDQPATERSV